MARLKRKLKKHWRSKRMIYGRALLIIGLLAGAVWVAQLIGEKENKHDELVKELSGTLEEKYQNALKKAADGEMGEARMAMYRLARLGDSADKPLGYGPAHLWVARDALSHFDTGFMWQFPFRNNGQMEVPSLDASKEVKKAQLHLEQAVALNPELEDASLILAATYVATGKRNQAVEVLVGAVTQSDHPHPKLEIPLINVLAQSGDDLALKDRAWYWFSSLGHTVSLGRSSNISERVKYVISALILHKDENADVALVRLESQYLPYSEQLAVGNHETQSKAKQFSESVRALRMAYHYQRAVTSYRKALKLSVPDYTKVIDELELALKSQSFVVEGMVKAMTQIVQKEPTLKPRVRAILKSLLLSKKRGEKTGGEEESGDEEKHFQSILLLALGELGGEKELEGHSSDVEKEGVSVVKQQKYLEAALRANANNADAALKLAELLVNKKNPDDSAARKWANDAIKWSDIKKDKKRIARSYAVIGKVQLREGKPFRAVASLEKALIGNDDTASVHRLLAKAYSMLGKQALAKEHLKKMKEKQ